VKFDFYIYILLITWIPATLPPACESGIGSVPSFVLLEDLWGLGLEGLVYDELENRKMR
jgi:hypothetical protein